MVEHAAVVLETAVKMMPQHVHQLDAVLDLKHFQLRYNLDPRGVIGAGELLKYAFRDVLRSIMFPGYMVAAVSGMDVRCSAGTVGEVKLIC